MGSNVNWNKIEFILLDLDGTLLDLNFDLHFWLEYIPKVYSKKHNISFQDAKKIIVSRIESQEGKLTWYCLDFWEENLELDIMKLKKDISSDFNYKSAFFIGFFQILSLIPGVSRSGISITAARFLKFKRFDSAKISFLLSIPTLGAVSLFGLKNLLTNDDINISILNLVSIFLSYIFSLITINYFLKYIKNFSLSIFVIYRIILGFILLFFAYL